MKLAIALCVLVPTIASAQVVVNPTVVEFVASADHHATNLGGQALVTRYDLSWVAQNVMGAIAFTKQLGKPTPDAKGLIQVKVAELATLPEEQIHVATVTAVGAGGSAVSLPSNPFGRSGQPRLPAAPTNVVVRP